MYKPTKTQFIDWLKSKRPGQHVGHSISYYGCPIARFITEMQDDVHMASVGGFLSLYELRGSGQTIKMGQMYELPKWARTFVDQVDLLASGTIITAKRALAVMEEM